MIAIEINDIFLKMIAGLAIPFAIIYLGRLSRLPYETFSEIDVLLHKFHHVLILVRLNNIIFCIFYRWQFNLLLSN